jgi:membrane-bound lytic murein transglycosylase B
MKLNLKTILLFSSLLAVTLNVWQYLASNQQRKDAFAPSWAYADSPSATASPAPATHANLAAAPAPAAVPATVSAPAADPVAAAATRLSAAGLKPDYAALYLAVQQQTGTPWQLLAAVHKVETGQSGSTGRSSYAGATGPMQFMPATFNHYAVDADGNGTRDITDLDDAMLTAGRYLAAGGAARGQYSTALYNYNHSWSYVSTVTSIAKRLGL